MEEKNYTANHQFRRKAVVCWILSGVLIVACAGSILFFKNPWSIYKMNAKEEGVQRLQLIADSKAPYVKIDGMELTFTGYYTVDDDGDVHSYCYMGTLSDKYVLVDLPAKDNGALVEEDAQEEKNLTDYTFTAQAVSNGSMTDWLAKTEDMTSEEYRSYYNVADVELYVYGSDMESVRIYYLMCMVLIAGTFAAGLIFWSEAKLMQKNLAAGM